MAYPNYNPYQGQQFNGQQFSRGTPYDYNTYNPYPPQYGNINQYNPVMNGLQSPLMGQNQPSAVNNVFSWVNGIEGAKAFPMSPNGRAWLMDSERKKFYIKISDANGISTIQSYNYYGSDEPKENEEQKQNDVSVITRDDFERLENKLKNCEQLIQDNYDLLSNYTKSSGNANNKTDKNDKKKVGTENG